MKELQIRWQPTDKGIRILQTYSDQISINIPAYIEGLPVTEIGPYCFSASEPKDRQTPFFLSSITYNEDLSVSEDKRLEAPTLPALNGRYVEEITLPSAVSVLHNAAFYNCRRLLSLSVGPAIRAIGSDEFTNCSKLTRLLYRGHEAEAAGLSLLLERIETDLEVIFLKEDSSIRGRLFFPEYYEWLDEISPAHLFSRSIHGEGFRMRKCFQNGALDYGKYDSCFENAVKTESEKTACLIALDRLRYPNMLQEDCRRLYKNTIQESFYIALSMAIENRSIDLLCFLFGEFSLELAVYTEAIRLGIEADWGEGTAWLMEAKHRAGNFIKKTYDFDDF